MVLDQRIGRLVEPAPSATGIAKKTLTYTLSRAAGAEQHHLPKIGVLLEWCEWLGLIRIEGEMVLPASSTGGTPLEATRQADVPSAPVTTGVEPEQVSPEPAAAVSRVEESAPAAFDPAILKFNLSVTLTADDVERLDKDQLDTLLSLVERMRG